PANDVIKLLEVAESCGGESYGRHRRNPLLRSFVGPVIAGEALLRLDRPQEALARVDAARRLRPDDERALSIWRISAEASARRLDQSPKFEDSQQQGAASSAARPPVFVVNT